MKAEAIAKVCHEVNRAYCQAIRDKGEWLPWHETAPEVRNSCIAGVKTLLADPGLSARESHQSWLDWHISRGWKYGSGKSVTQKEHPNMVPFGDLPVEQQAKDYIFAAIVRELRDD